MSYKLLLRLCVISILIVIVSTSALLLYQNAPSPKPKTIVMDHSIELENTVDEDQSETSASPMPLFPEPKENATIELITETEELLDEERCLSLVRLARDDLKDKEDDLYDAEKHYDGYKDALEEAEEELIYEREKGRTSRVNHLKSTISSLKYFIGKAKEELRQAEVWVKDAKLQQIQIERKCRPYLRPEYVTGVVIVK